MNEWSSISHCSRPNVKRGNYEVREFTANEPREKERARLREPGREVVLGAGA